MDYILAAILALSSSFVGIFATMKVFPGIYGFVLSVLEYFGSCITTYVSLQMQRLLWLLSRLHLMGPPSPNYPVDFQFKSDKLSELVMSLVTPPLNEEQVFCHGYCYMKLFQIRRCLKWHLHSFFLDAQNKSILTSQVASIERAMKNYRDLTPSQIILAYLEITKLKPMFNDL